MKPSTSMNGVFLSILLLTAHISTAYASDAACTPLTPKKIAALFDRWNNSLKTKNPEKVAANYAADAILLPTLSNIPRTNHAQIIDYFTSFLKANPVGKIDQRVIRYGDDWATDTGLYTFELTQNGKRQEVEARYSFVYECINGHWLIIHHHSSSMPEKED